MLLENRSIIL